MLACVRCFMGTCVTCFSSSSMRCGCVFWGGVVSLIFDARINFTGNFSVALDCMHVSHDSFFGVGWILP